MINLPDNIILTRDYARDFFADNHLKYTENELVFIAYPIHKDDIQKLYEICQEHLDAGEGDMPMKMHKNYIVNTNRNGAIKCAYLTVDGEYFKDREAISFNRDGWIGFCGWADFHNSQPFLRAFIEWVQWFVSKYGETPTCS